MQTVAVGVRGLMVLDSRASDSGVGVFWDVESDLSYEQMARRITWWLQAELRQRQVGRRALSLRAFHSQVK